MDFKNVNKKYRPIPFWSWNERLETEETRRQVAIMDEKGVGGYFMHARGGLMTEYMGDEWFDNIKAACDEGNARGMHPWAYDENGWPSGFGGGAVNGLGEEYQQKALHVEKLTDENKNAPHTVAIKDGYRYYYTVNEFYVDVMDKKVTSEFIEQVYKKYEERVGHDFEGFFTDEPQIMRGTGYPWSFPFKESFKEKYGYDLIEHIDELFFENGDYKATRVNFWKLATELFSENFLKQIYEFCESRGYKLTGHLLLEEHLYGQMMSSGASMPHYEYFHIPGMDWLGRGICECLTPAALGSAAAQLGKKQVLSETFALSGHNVSHGELKRMYEWQMVRGVNLLCTHLEGYSLRGIRKRDYPPAMYYQQPWWQDMDIFFDTVSRIGMLLAEGKVSADTLVILPTTTAWMLYNDAQGILRKEMEQKIDYYQKKVLAIMNLLDRKHVLYHLGDEILMERHGEVIGKELRIGEMKYSKVIIPENLGFLPNTDKLLSEFKENGGVITTAEDISPNPITEENALTYTKREFDGYELHYFVNSTNSPVFATFANGNIIMNAQTGETSQFYGSYSFAPGESIVIIDNHEPRERSPEEKRLEKLSLLGEWRVKNATYNSITLDRCDYYFDGELVAKCGYVLDILPRLNELRRPVELTQRYTFNAEYTPDVLYLCIETPEIFEVTCNGKRIPCEIKGDFVDKSFKLLDIADAVVIGENELIIKGTLSQSEKTYHHLENSWAFETMKNSLSYDMEVEQIYLVGDFGAKITGELDTFEPASYRIKSVPVIVAPPATVMAESLDRSGYPEFAGTLTLEREFDVEDTQKYVELVGKGINSIHIAVNGKEVATKMFAPFNVDLSEHLKTGKNTLTLTVINNLRNMQGPLHLNAGDDEWISPAAFYRESNVFAHPGGRGESYHGVRAQFNDDIGLVHFGLTD